MSRAAEATSRGAHIRDEFFGLDSPSKVRSVAGAPSRTRKPTFFEPSSNPVARFATSNRSRTALRCQINPRQGRCREGRKRAGRASLIRNDQAQPCPSLRGSTTARRRIPEPLPRRSRVRSRCWPDTLKQWRRPPRALPPRKVTWSPDDPALCRWALCRPRRYRRVRLCGGK